MQRWTRSHDEQVKQILARMSAEATPFPDMSPAAVKARKALPFFDWCRCYFPHYGIAPEAPMHREAWAACQEEGMPVAICGASGFAKSSFFNTMDNARDILEKKRHFIIMGGRAEDVACAQMHFIRLELEQNPRIRADYGEVRVDGPDNDWTCLRTRVWARGIGQSPRGQRHGPHRPDKFVGDDLEDLIIARNPEREKELWDWIFKDVWERLGGAGSHCLFRVLTNTFGRNCLQVRFAEQAEKTDTHGRPLARIVIFRALDENGHSTWPEVFTDAMLERDRAIIGEGTWRSEKMAIPGRPEAPFKAEDIRHFDSAKVDRRKMRIVAFLDPAAGEKKQNDFKAHVVLAAEEGSPNRYCLHARLRRESVLLMIAHIIWIWITYRPGQFGCEANGFQAWVWPLLAPEQKKAGVTVNLRRVVTVENKADRILSNQPLFEQGLVYFDPAEGDQQVLIDQWLDFGETGVHDDGPDAWDRANRMLPGGTGAPEFYYRGGRRELSAGQLMVA